MKRNATMTTKSAHYRRRGNVLVMVISMLVMLFVFGTTFLLTARFDKIIARDQAAVLGGGASTGDTQSDKVAELISIDLRRQLRDDLVGGTGRPFDGDELNTDVTKDFGDGPGLDGLLSSLEPYFDTVQSDSVWYRMTTPHDNLDYLKLGAPPNQQYPGGLDESALKNVPLNVALDPGLLPPGGTWDTAYGSVNAPHNAQFEWWTVLGATAAVTVPDAEGDGMPSSMIWTNLDRPDDPFTIFDDSLVLDESVQAMGTYGERYAAAVRVIPNGAMVTVYRDRTESGTFEQTPDALVQAVRVLGDGDLDAIPNTSPLDPLLEEPVLRNRFFLPRDFQDPQVLPTQLETLWPQTLLPGSLQIAGRYRSWPVDYTSPDFNLNQLWWEQRLLPLDSMGSPNPNYDRRHLVTTISYDDVYRRRAAGPGETTKKVFEGIQGGIPFAVGLKTILVDYPSFSPAFSTPPSRANGNLMFSLRGLRDVGPLLPGVQDPDKGQQLAFLYAYFRAMLENVDSSLMTDLQRNTRAAALAINTWDYFDADLEPTHSLDIIGARGQYTFLDGTQQTVLGLEGQPFITEAYVGDSSDPDGDFDEYGFELFNPWPFDITLVGGNSLATAEWGFSDGNGQIDGSNIVPLDTTITIPAASTPGLVNMSGNRNLSVITNKAGLNSTPTETWDLENHPGIDVVLGTGKIALHRKVGINWYKVDQIEADATNQPDNVTTWLPPEPAIDYSQSLRRELLAESATVTRSTWKFCVGAETEVGGRSLGLENGSSALIGSIAGVPLVWNNSGMPERAFPSTGSLLLVAAVANEGGRPFATIVAEELDRVDKIDSGHMPIFDQQDDTDPINLRADVWEPWEGAYDSKDLPWGQLVYDYFTVLPVEAVTAANRTKYAGLPIVERVVDLNGNVMYGPRVKGRVNINAAPWTVMDGIPVLSDTAWQNGGDLPVLELEGLPLSTDNPPEIGQWFELNGGVWTVTPNFALLIQSYRENRNVELSGVMGTTPLRRLGARVDDGLLSVGEMANVILSAGDNFDQGWDTTTLNYLDVVAPLVRITDWVTVKSNVFTVYTTVVDREEDDGTIRMLQTIDRTNTLYSNELPAVVSKTVLKQ